MFDLRVLFVWCVRSVSSASVTLVGVGIYVMCLFCVLVYMLYVLSLWRDMYGYFCGICIVCGMCHVCSICVLGSLCTCV